MNTSIDNKLSREKLTEAVRLVDLSFEENIAMRRPIEKVWQRNIKAFTEGSAPASNVSSLVNSYTNLSDMTLPTRLRISLAQKLAFMRTDWFKLRPDGINVTDLQLTSCVEEFIKQKLQRRESGFESAMRNSLFQLECLNISAVQFGWERKIAKRKKSVSHHNQESVEKNTEIIKIIEEPEELVYQGPTMTFVNMFNCYPDITNASAFNDLNSLNIFYREVKPCSEVINDERFNPEKSYLYADSVIYRALDGMHELLDSNYSRKYSEEELISKNIIGKNKILKSYVELRTAYLKEFKVEGVGNFENVCVFYAKGNGKIVPLLIEYNPFDFNAKPIRFFEDWDNPFDPYPSGQNAIAANQHFYIVFLKQLKAYTSGKALMPSELIPANYRKAFIGSDDEFNELYNKPGGQGFYNPEKLLPGKDNILRLGGFDKIPQDLSVMNAEISDAKKDIIEAVSSVQLNEGLGGTATEIRDIANRLDRLSKPIVRKISEEILKPFLEFTIENLKNLLIDENVVSGVTKEELEALISPEEKLEDLIKIFKTLKMPILKEYPASIVPGTDTLMSIGIAYNPVTEQKLFKLTRALLYDFRADVKILIDGNDYSKPHELETFTNLYGNILRFATNEELRSLISRIAIEHLLDLTKHPKAKEINKAIENILLNAKQPTVTEQAQTIQTLAKTREAEAKAQNLAANALQRQLENQQSVISGISSTLSGQIN